MKVLVSWTEVCQHSAIIEAPDDVDLTDGEVRENLLEEALELSGTLDAVTDRTLDDVEEADPELRDDCAQCGATGRPFVYENLCEECVTYNLSRNL